MIRSLLIKLGATVLASFAITAGWFPGVAQADVITTLRRHSVRRVGLILALCLAGSTLFATTAQAAHVKKYDDTGRVYYEYAYVGYDEVSIGPVLWSGINWITEAPGHAGYKQKVTVSFRVWDYHRDIYWPWREHWVGPLSPVTVSASIPAAATRTPGGWDYTSYPETNDTRFGFDVVVTWSIASTGKYIGRMIIDYDAGTYADLRCGAPLGCTYDATIDWMKPN